MTAPDAERRATGDIWRALANPVRRALLDALAEGPRTTGELASRFPGLSRFAVMQHLAVLGEAGLVLVRRRGRYRYNHLNPVPLRRWYEQWVAPLAGIAATEMLALERRVEREGAKGMAREHDEVRTVRIETELRFKTTPDRLFGALTTETETWFPFTYGAERVRAVVVEAWVGGRHYEDWGDGAGHLYGHVTAYDPPRRFATRGRIMPGTILDTSYELTPDGDETILAMTKIAFGPMTQEEADSIRTYGDLGRFADAIRSLVEAGR